MDTLRDFILFLMPVVIAQLTSSLGEWIQQLIPWLDRRGVMVKRLFVATLAFTLTHAASALGNVALNTNINELLGGNIGAIDPTDVGSLLTAGLAYFFHKSSKTNKTT